MNNPSETPTQSKTKFAALKIIALYILLSGVWIFYSDRLVASRFKDAETISQIQTYKGF